MNTPSPGSIPNEPTCQKCGKPIPDGSPRGLCALCLISAVAKTDGPSLADVPSPELDELLTAFPQFESLEPLGAGGMGRVYKARHAHLDRTVALKLLPPAYAADPEWVERFTREARALARLNHPNIVQVHDFGEATTGEGDSARKFPFLIMEYVDGVNLRQTLRSGTLTAREALSIVPLLCGALQYAHDQGVLHRDIKPENILLDTQGRVKIADFGLAKLNGESKPGLNLTATGAQLGTAAYMAPEQLEKPHEVDHRADIYSLGVVFYEMLTGELPLGRFLAPSEKAGTDPRLDTIVFRTLEKERDRRFQTATEMKSEVDSVVANPPAFTSDPDQWMIRCATCGRTARLSDVGGIRIGAASIGKRTLIRCSQCGKTREGIIARLRDLPAGTVPVEPAAAPQSAPARWPVALILTLLLFPFGIVALLLLVSGAYLAASRGGTLLSIAVPVVFLLAIAGVIAGLTWLYGRLRQAGWSAVAAVLVVALCAGVLPVGGCVAAVFAPAFLAGSRSVRAPFRAAAVDVVTASRSPAVGRLPAGSIELLGVSNPASKSDLWWRMDGNAPEAGPFVHPSPHVSAGDNERAYEFVFRTAELPPGSTLMSWKVADSRDWSLNEGPALVSAPDQPLANHTLLTASLPARARSADIRVGVATDDWATILNTGQGGPGMSSPLHEGVRWKLSWGEPVKAADGEIVSTWTAPRHEEWESRVVAVQSDGSLVPASRRSFTNEQTAWKFPGLGEPRSVDFHFQVRRVRWVDFRGIRLSPKFEPVTVVIVSAHIVEEKRLVVHYTNSDVPEGFTMVLAADGRGDLESADSVQFKTDGKKTWSVQDHEMHFDFREFRIPPESAEAALAGVRSLGTFEMRPNQSVKLFSYTDHGSGQPVDLSLRLHPIKKSPPLEPVPK